MSAVVTDADLHRGVAPFLSDPCFQALDPFSKADFVLPGVRTGVARVSVPCPVSRTAAVQPQHPGPPRANL